MGSRSTPYIENIEAPERMSMWQYVFLNVVVVGVIPHSQRKFLCSFLALSWLGDGNEKEVQPDSMHGRVQLLLRKPGWSASFSVNFERMCGGWQFSEWNGDDKHLPHLETLQTIQTIPKVRHRKARPCGATVVQQYSLWLNITEHEFICSAESLYLKPTCGSETINDGEWR